MHWDGEKVKFASGEVKERLVICLQHVGSEDQPRFLGAPQTPDGTGAAQCEALVRYVDESGIGNLLIGHVWDTTSSNTGCNLGAAVLLDKAMNQANLWLGCRRHVAERHCVHANETVCGKTKSPEESLFKNFKEQFDSLDTSNVQKYEWAGDESSPIGPYKFATERALNISEWAEKWFEEGVFPREDYRELTELLTYVLHGNFRRKGSNKDKPPENVDFKMERPGAFRHARCMAKAIYNIKMFLLL